MVHFQYNKCREKCDVDGKGHLALEDIMDPSSSHKKYKLVVRVLSPILPKPKKPRKAQWEFNIVFQDVQVDTLPWVEAMLGVNGKMMMVKFKV